MDFLAKLGHLLERTRSMRMAISLFIIGILICAYGLHQFFEIQGMENLGQEVRLTKKTRWIYNLFGKFGLLFFTEIVGVLILGGAKYWATKHKTL